MRVTLDTGVVVSALLFPRGRVAWLRDRWIGGGVQSLVSQATVEELIRVLAYPKFRPSRGEIEAVLAAYIPFTEAIILGRSGGQTTLPECNDPADQEFLRLALVGDADALVTGDDDLLRLRDQTPFRILTPAQLKSRLP